MDDDVFLMGEAERCHIAVRLASLSLAGLASVIEERGISPKDLLSLAECLGSLKTHIEESTDRLEYLTRLLVQSVIPKENNE